MTQGAPSTRRHCNNTTVPVLLVGLATGITACSEGTSDSKAALRQHTVPRSSRRSAFAARTGRNCWAIDRSHRLVPFALEVGRNDTRGTQWAQPSLLLPCVWAAQAYRRGEYLGHGGFTDLVETTGWGQLRVRVGESCEDSRCEGSWAAGYLEGKDVMY
jgi:hypothetical protein